MPGCCMDKRELLNKCARSEDERILLSRIWDKYDQCRSRNIPASTGFLSPAEAESARALLSAMGVTEGFAFRGGYEGAERCQLHFLPDWAQEPEDTVCAVRAAWYQGDKLTHRDFLGSLMGLGIVRETIGDILVSDDHTADVLCSSTVAGYLLQNWDGAGRTKLQVQEVALHDLHLPQARCREVRDTLSSLRLDNVVAAGFALSRGRASEAISSGKVQLNWVECTKCDRAVAQGDTVTLRGAGKMELLSVGNLTKKGRISVVIRRYI